MNDSEIKDRLILALTQIAPEAQDELIEDMENLQDQLDLDSVDIMNYIIKVQDIFNIQISNKDYSNFLSVDAGVRCVQKYLS